MQSIIQSICFLNSLHNACSPEYVFFNIGCNTSNDLIIGCTDGKFIATWKVCWICRLNIQVIKYNFKVKKFIINLSCELKFSGGNSLHVVYCPL